MISTVGADAGQFWAMVIAILLVLVGYWVMRQIEPHGELGPHSPGRWALLCQSVNALVRRDTKRDTDTDSDADHITVSGRCSLSDCTNEHDWIADPEDPNGTTTIRVHRYGPSKPLSPLGAYCREQLLEGKRHKDILASAREAGFKNFSRSTFDRQYRKAKAVIKEWG